MAHTALLAFARAALLVALTPVAGCGGGAATPPPPSVAPRGADVPCPVVASPVDPPTEEAGLFAVEVEVGEPSVAGVTRRYQGRTDASPDEVYERYRSSGELDLLGGETEGHEAEVLASDGNRRIALKVVRCSDGSSLDATVAPEQPRQPEPRGEQQERGPAG